MGIPQNVQGYIYGPIDDEGKITGSEAAYIYPRSKLALVGKFRNNQMLSAQKSEIEKISCKNNKLSIGFSKPNGPKFHRSLSTNSSLGDMTLVQDPYEAITVEIRYSTETNFGKIHISCRH